MFRHKHPVMFPNVSPSDLHKYFCNVRRTWCSTCFPSVGVARSCRDFYPVYSNNNRLFVVPHLYSNNSRLFVAPHLARAQSAYKDIRIRSFDHTHTHARTRAHARMHARAHTHTHTHTHKHTTDTCISGDGWVKLEERKQQISMQKRRGGFSVLT